MVSSVAVSPLWDDEKEPPEKAESKALFVTLPVDLMQYVKQVSRPGKGGQKEYVVALITFDRDFQARLEPDKDRIRAFAAARALSMKEDRAQIVAELVKQALDCLEKKGHRK